VIDFQVYVIIDQIACRTHLHKHRPSSENALLHDGCNPNCIVGMPEVIPFPLLDPFVHKPRLT
jgi:hypothetical protein